MKNTLLVLLLFFAKTMFSQEDFGQKVAYKLLDYSYVNGVEKVFLHFDKPDYTVGENICFKSYIVEGVKYKSDPGTEVFYCDLLENQSGILIKKATYKSYSGLGDGFFPIPDSLASGKYIFRAYTKYMENFDEKFFFHRNINIFNPKKEVLKNVLPFDFQLDFMPESGKLVEDIQTKVAFKVSDNQGQSIDCQGVIIGQKGDTITTFATEKFGLGYFRLKPKANEKYTAKLTINGKIKDFPLPKIEQYGYILNVDNLTSLETVSLGVKAKLPENELKKPMLIIAQAHGNFAFLGRFESSNSKTVLAIPKAMFPDGIVQFTVFDEKGTPFVERIVYNKSPKLLNINVLLEKEKTQNSENLALSFSVFDKDGKPVDADLSLSVTDSLLVMEDEFAQNVTSYLPLCADMKNRVEAPSYYFNRKNPDASKHLDLLMMSQNWSRFTWKNILQDEKNKNRFSAERNIQQTRPESEKGRSSTIFWQPNIEVKNGKAKVILPSTKAGITLNINVQGKNENGALCAELIKYRLN